MLITHWVLATESPMPRCSWGSITLTTVASSPTMNWADATTTRIHQRRLSRGASPGPAFGAVLTVVLTCSLPLPRAVRGADKVGNLDDGDPLVLFHAGAAPRAIGPSRMALPDARACRAPLNSP